jgi:hypothetical protein
MIDLDVHAVPEIHLQTCVGTGSHTSQKGDREKAPRNHDVLSYALEVWTLVEGILRE